MQALDRFAPYAHWLLRIALASIFIFHGFGKWFDFAGTAMMLGGTSMAILVATMETAGGLLVLVGGLTRDWVTRLGGLLIAPVMLGAIFMVHWPRWSFMATEEFPMGGMEFQVAMFLTATYFILTGNHQATAPHRPHTVHSSATA